MSLKPSDPRISLRPVSLPGTDGSGGDSDLPFLRELYASTRREEVAAAGWPQPEAEGFLTQQFEAQHAHYIANYPGATFDLILLDEPPGKKIKNRVGRLYLHESDTDVNVMDIALLPEHRAQKIGGSLIQDIIALATTAGKNVTLHVEPTNPAIRLYDRLGFREVDSNGVYQRMEWTVHHGHNRLPRLRSPISNGAAR